MWLLGWVWRKIFRALCVATYFALRPLRQKDVTQDGMLYLRRYALSPRIGLARLVLHEIRMSDRDRFPHDHPQGFTSLIIRGGYTEKLYVCGKPIGETTLRAGDILTRDATTFAHRLTDVLPNTWTLVLWHRGHDRSFWKKTPVCSWGFWSPDGEFTPEELYLKSGSPEGAM